MRNLHIVPGTDDVANGMVVVARFLAKEQGDAEVVDLKDADCRKVASADEVWVHGMWLPREWKVCRWALKAGKPFVRMTHGSLSPMYLNYQGKWKKRLVGPIERFFLRRAKAVVATCEAETDWIRTYLGRRCPPVEVTDIKRFFNLSRVEHVDHVDGELHLLYLGRRHPLKGVEYLEAAVRQIEESTRSTCSTRLKIVSSAFGEEKEQIWSWCDVLVLPTLSDNFGLVIAEALERGKRVITTDGAPAWGDSLEFRVLSLESKESPDSGVKCSGACEIWSGYGGRLLYLKGYREGSPEQRVRLLKEAIGRLN